MPPKRNHDNVDVDDEGDRDGDSDEVGEIKTIWIVNLNSENREKFMCEMCSSFLKSAESLSRHKMSIHVIDNDNKYLWSDCGFTSKTWMEHNNHKMKHKTFDCKKSI